MINYGEGKYKISLNYQYIGEDILVIITGGISHIGGVSLCETNILSSIKKINHKDDIVTKQVAPFIYNKLDKDTLVICGIHLDNATTEDIDIVLSNTQQCLNKFINMQKGNK